MGWLTEESQRKEIKDLKEEVFILKVLLAVTGKSEEPEKKELLIGAPKEEKQGGKKK